MQNKRYEHTVLYEDSRLHSHLSSATRFREMNKVLLISKQMGHSSLSSIARANNAESLIRSADVIGMAGAGLSGSSDIERSCSI